jgi:hypothetical protein
MPAAAVTTVSAVTTVTTVSAEISATRVTALVLALALSTAACKTEGECEVDGDCPALNACLSSMCVARAGPAGYRAAVELEPALESPHARREHPAVTFTADPATLELDRRISVHAVLLPAIPEPSDRASSVEVVLSLPSLLPGRPENSVNADAINQGPRMNYEATVGVPERWLERPARLRVVPNMPVDRILCPWQLDAVVSADLVVPLPGDSDTVRVEGRIVSAAPDGGMLAYEARLFAGNRLLSNLGRTDANGKFLLRAQKQLLTDRNDATIEIAQADFKNPSTSLVLPFAGESANLGEVTFPAIPAPVGFVVPVYDAQSQGTNLKAPVAGASVRFFTRIGSATSAEVQYVRTGQTGVEGTATIPLLPGSGSDTREYVVSVVPPADSPTGSLCVPKFFIAAAVATNRVTATIFLPRKAVLTGQVLRWDGKPAPRMNLRATRIDASFAPECGTNLASPPSDGAAAEDGTFQLLLDPGDYMLELDPPSGSGLPRHALPLLKVTAPNTDLDITLPEGILVDGKVISPAGEPVAATRVRVFPIDGGGALLGTTLSGPDGSFRLVLPRLP